MLGSIVAMRWREKEYNAKPKKLESIIIPLDNAINLEKVELDRNQAGPLTAQSASTPKAAPIWIIIDYIVIL